MKSEVVLCRLTPSCLILNAPGPTPQLFVIMGQALAHHTSAQAAGFVNQVFSLHDPAELQNLISGAGFRQVSVQADTRSLRLPAAGDFLWQYVYNTPLVGVVGQMNDEQRASLESEVVAKWQQFADDHSLMLQVRMVTATARK